VYGAMAAGQAGAHRALAVLQDELIRTMQLCGLSSLSDIGAELLVHTAAQENHPSIQSLESL
jgi:(S)-mandelate dehydrogenase